MEDRGNGKTTGSTFLRAESLVSCTNDFETFVHGKKYDNLIFQKVYWKEMKEQFTGPKILDLCDPDWLVENINLIKLANLVDAITCSSDTLTELVQNYLPNKMVVHVPDRLNFNWFPSPRALHEGEAKKLVWFGYIHNAHETLPQLLPAITQYNLKLRIISDGPYSKQDGISKLDIEYIPYDQKTAYNLIKECDILLNPKSNKVLYKYKSNNKTLIGWKLGLPVAITNSDITTLMSPDMRNDEIIEKQKLIEKEYCITQSALQYRKIIDDIRQRKCP